MTITSKRNIYYTRHESIATTLNDLPLKLDLI